MSGVEVDASVVVRTLDARYRQALANAANREADYVREIAHLEAFVAQQAARIAELEQPAPQAANGAPDPWRDELEKGNHS